MRAFVILGDVFCFFVAEFWELVGVFCRFGADVCLPWAILAMSSCRWVRVGEREHKRAGEGDRNIHLEKEQQTLARIHGG
jgi:hypothetical protein